MLFLASIILPRKENGSCSNSVLREKCHSRVDLQCTGSEVIKPFSCSTQLSINFFMLINVKMPTNVGSLTFMRWKNNILGLSEPEEC